MLLLYISLDLVIRRIYGNNLKICNKRLIYRDRSTRKLLDDVRTKYIQEDREFKIGEGTKVDASFSLEELQNHKAMLHMDRATVE